MLKSKIVGEVVWAFESIFRDSQTPEKLQMDACKECFNKRFKMLMDKHDIIHFATASDLKAWMIEGFNKTLKTIMRRYFTANNTQRSLHIVQDLTHSYNHSFHKSIKMIPMQVIQKNICTVFQNIYGTFPLHGSKMKPKFEKGDQVKASRHSGLFLKVVTQESAEELPSFKQVSHKLQRLHAKLLSNRCNPAS